MQAEEWDVIIVGGGPAGLSTWLHLAAVAPHVAARTLLIEQHRYPRDKPCGGGITPLGDLLLQGLGIEIDVPGVVVNEVHFRCGDALRRIRRPGAMRVVRRREFDQALAAAAVERGMTLHQGEAFVGFRRAGADVRVETTQGEYRTRVLVGADGVRSRVRRALGGRGSLGLARLIKWVAPVGPAVLDCTSRGVAEFDFSPMTSGIQGYIWRFPCEVDGSPAVDLGIYDSLVWPDQKRPALRDVWNDLSAGGTALPPATTGTVATVRWFGAVPAPSQPNVFLVGDAAGVDAALGEGIAHALDYGDFAAHAIANAFQRGDFSFADIEARGAEHPLQQGLQDRYRLARAMYAGGAEGLAHLGSLLAAWLPVE